MKEIFVLLTIYQLKHFLADYPLQGQYMLGKFKPGWEFFQPLTAHCLVHALMTLWISMIYLIVQYGLPTGTLPFKLAVLDFVAHFAMDRIKAGPKYLGRFKSLSPSEFKACQSMVENDTQRKDELGLAAEMGRRKIKGNTFFWWSLGVDQAVHHLTHYAIIYFLITA